MTLIISDSSENGDCYLAPSEDSDAYIAIITRMPWSPPEVTRKNAEMICRKVNAHDDLIKSRDELLNALNGLMIWASMREWATVEALHHSMKTAPCWTEARAALASAEKTASKPAEKAIEADDDEEYTLDNREGRAKPTKG